MKKITLILMILTILTKIIGFFRDVTLSYFYGASNISDAYLISLTIPGTIFAFIGTGIATSFLPMYSKIESESDIETADKFTSNLVNILVVVSSITILLAIIFVEPLVKIFASGFSGDTLIIAKQFTRITLFGIYFSMLVYLMSAFLRIKENFYQSTIMYIPYSIVIILSIGLSSKYGLYLLPIGSLIALLSQFLYLLYYIPKTGYKYKLLIDLRDKNIKGLMYLAIPVILGVSVNQINVLVDRTLASQIAIGGIASLTYANRLNLFIQGVFVTSIATVVYPILTKYAVENKTKEFKKMISDTIIGLSILVIPASIGFMSLSKEIVVLLFGRGAFDVNAVTLTSQALLFYSIGMIGYALREILSRVYYSLQDTKTPMINASIGMIINIILNILLSRILGISGLALATSISALFTSSLLIFNLRTKIDNFDFSNIFIKITKILLASIVMGIFLIVFKFVVGELFTNTVTLFISILLGVIIYIVIIRFMKIEEIEDIFRLFQSKFKKSSRGE